MPSKSQSKDSEEIFHAIQDLTTIRSQTEVNETCQTNIEARNDLIQSSLTMLRDDVSSLPPHVSSSFHSKQKQTNTLITPFPSLRPSKLQLALSEGLDPLDWLFQLE